MPGQYQPAAVCRRGHVETADTARRASVAQRCSECGAAVLTACPSCDFRIRGRYRVEGVIGSARNYEPPNFCDRCGGPFPWVDRRGRIYELQNLLDEEDLDSATELEVREQLEALADIDPDDEEQAARRWKRVKEKAPGLWEKSGAKAILESVVSAGVKSGLGL